MTPRLPVLLISMAALAACSPKPVEAPAAPEAAASAAPAAATAPAVKDATVTAQAAPEALPTLPENYWDARKALIAAGYAPVAHPDAFKVCVEEMEGASVPYGQCKQEIVLPEVEACAGTGEANCRIEWRSPGGRTLTIFTVDEPQPGVITEMEWSAAGGSAGQG